MGLMTGIGSIVAAGIGAASSAHTQAANAAAQSKLNKKTMDFNHKEAILSRNWQAEQSVLDRQFNSAQSATARSWTANQAALERNFNASEALKARQFESVEAEKARTFDAQQALLARQFEQRMSNSAHQREVRDLRLAGLNPILSATGGNGASTPAAPVIGAPLPSAPSASSGVPSGVSASHNSSGGAQASIGPLSAFMKKDVINEFVHSAIDGLRLDNEVKKAKADDMNAQAHMMDALTNARRQMQDKLESMARITNIKSNTDLNIIRQRGEEEQVKLYKEKILSEVQERLNKKNVSDATVYNLTKCAEAAGTAAFAQAKMAEIQDRVQSAESPERVAKLKKEQDYYQSLFDKNKWIMEDPKEAARRKWWRENPEAAHANEIFDIVGNVVHGNVGIHTGN